MTGRTALPLTLVLTAVVCLTPGRASAQASVSDVLSFLITNQSVSTGDFVRDRLAAQATADTISGLVQVSLPTLPTSPAAGGFMYRFNPSLGTVQRVSDSFGPFYIERALTIGRDQTSIGMSFRHTAFDSLDGRSLRDGTLVTTANRLNSEPQPFDQDLLTLRMDAETYALFGSYGVTDRLEIGAAVPLVTFRLSGERLNHYRGTVLQQASGSASATGLGDIVLRTKYNVVQTAASGIAASVDVQLPTGDEADLLGAGRTGVQISAIGSLERGRVGAHFQGGIGRGGASDAVSFGGALVVAAGQRFNVIGEVFGQQLSALSRVGEATAPHPTVPNVTTSRLLPIDSGTSTILGSAGFKWNVGGTWIVNANVLFPLTDTGLTGRATPSIALDYTF